MILIRLLKYLKCRHVSRSRKEEKLRLKYALLAEQVFYKRAWYGWSMTTGQPMGRQDMGGQACFVIAPAAFTDRFTNVGLHLLQNCFRCSKILKRHTNNCKGWLKYFWANIEQMSANLETNILDKQIVGQKSTSIVYKYSGYYYIKAQIGQISINIG